MRVNLKVRFNWAALQREFTEVPPALPLNGPCHKHDAGCNKASTPGWYDKHSKRGSGAFRSDEDTVVGRYVQEQCSGHTRSAWYPGFCRSKNYHAHAIRNHGPKEKPEQKLLRKNKRFVGMQDCSREDYSDGVEA